MSRHRGLLGKPMNEYEMYQILNSDGEVVDEFSQMKTAHEEAQLLATRNNKTFRLRIKTVRTTFRVIEKVTPRP